jgi:hypothetical protein
VTGPLSYAGRASARTISSASNGTTAAPCALSSCTIPRAVSLRLLLRYLLIHGRNSTDRANAWPDIGGSSIGQSDAVFCVADDQNSLDVHMVRHQRELDPIAICSGTTWMMTVGSPPLWGPLPSDSPIRTQPLSICERTQATPRAH